MSELVIFPGIAGEPGKRGGGAILLRIVLGPEDTKLLDVFASTHGICRDDAAGRALRIWLRHCWAIDEPSEPCQDDERGGG